MAEAARSPWDSAAAAAARGRSSMTTSADNTTVQEESKSSSLSSPHHSTTAENNVASPVPLQQDETDNAAILSLASQLAPEMERVETLLHQYTTDDINNAPNRLPLRLLEDDDMESEWKQLTDSAAILRDELAQADSFDYWQNDENDNNNRDQIPLAAPHISEMDHDEGDEASPELKDAPALASLGAATLPPIRIPSFSTPRKRTSSTDSMNREPDHHTPVSQQSLIVLLQSPEDRWRQRQRTSSHDSRRYTYQHHLHALGVCRETGGGWYTTDLTPHVVVTGNHDSMVHTRAVKEYCVSMPDAKLKNMFVGLNESMPSHHVPAAGAHRVPPPDPDASRPHNPNHDGNGNDPVIVPLAPALPPLLVLPVRTMTIRLRPDVLCGAVMDGVMAALSAHGDLEKRQGGHVRARVRGCQVRSDHEAVMEHPEDGDDNDDDDDDAVTPEMQPLVPRTYYPGFVMDVQLCTRKSETCERMLLIRVYHADRADDTVHTTEEETTDEYLVVSTHTAQLSSTAQSTAASQHLREACALVQRLETPELARRYKAAVSRDLLDAADDNIELRRIVSQHLQTCYRACPSAKHGQVTLPALNADDYAVIQSSWRVVLQLWDELETRDVTYTTLSTCRFGAFPALPTLDVHYCSQLRRWSRERMIASLLQRASELEEYAREAEFACASMIRLLQSTFEAYRVEAPSLPQPTPLTSYPLDFVPPQASCPPWGQRVMEALNEVQAWTSGQPTVDYSPNQAAASIDGVASMAAADRAVAAVLAAFYQQDDEEQAARLGRKNVQVMDRLAKMQQHQLTSIHTLQNCANVSARARQAAHDFAQKTGGHQEVPLLKWSVQVGAATSGTLYVSAFHLCFVTQLMPMWGNTSIQVFDLREVQLHDLEANNGAATKLASSPMSMLLKTLSSASSGIAIHKDSREVYRFRPSIGGPRLKSFLYIVREAASITRPLAH